MQQNLKQYFPATYLTIPSKVYTDISSAKADAVIISLYFTLKLLIAENPAEIKYLAVYLKTDIETLQNALSTMQQLQWVYIDDEQETVQLA